MTKLAKILLMVVCFSLLAMALSFLTSSPAPAGPGSAPVTVVNTAAVNPVPTTVGNFPATQPVSGTVNVGNFPATQTVSLAAGSFSNTSTTPIFVDSETSARQRLAEVCNIGGFDSFGEASCTLGTVPTGTVFVIETVSGSLQFQTGGTRPVLIDLILSTGGTQTHNFFPATFQGSTTGLIGPPNDFFTLNEVVPLVVGIGDPHHNAPAHLHRQATFSAP